MAGENSSKRIGECELKFKSGLKDLVNEMSQRISRGEPLTPMDYYTETIRLAKRCLGPLHDKLLVAGRVDAWIQTYLSFVQTGLLLDIYYATKKA